MNNLKKFLLFSSVLVFIVGVISIFLRPSYTQKSQVTETSWWDIQSIDTVKYSRDLAREKANDVKFDDVIDKQVGLIGETGATHIAIGTPYNEEFVPILTRWVSAARKYGLKVWFRGNLSGWEGWFGYSKIGRKEHTNKIRDFILANGALFEEGDIFSSCPECENGGPGDPRITGDVVGHRTFLIEEYKATNEAFRKIGKNVRSNFIPMNGDVANLIMDKTTADALGRIVVIDHYVGTPEKLAVDIKKIAEKSGGKVILGEFGAPIPDIHGNLDDAEQALWIEDALYAISNIPELVGVNYWTGFGGSTKLWYPNYSETTSVEVIKRFFKPQILTGQVKDERGRAIEGAIVYVGSKKVLTSKGGKFSLPFLSDRATLTVQAVGYITQQTESNGENSLEILLIKGEKSLLFRIQKFLYNLVKK